MGLSKTRASERFKIFSGRLDPDNTINTMAGIVSVWVSENRVAPKSIGVEYLEGSQRIVLSLGYRVDESPYGVRFSCIRIGQVDPLYQEDLSEMEAEMSEACEEIPDAISHAVYVTEQNDFMMVFMRYGAAPSLG